MDWLYRKHYLSVYLTSVRCPYNFTFPDEQHWLNLNERFLCIKQFNTHLIAMSGWHSGVCHHSCLPLEGHSFGHFLGKNNPDLILPLPYAVVGLQNFCFDNSWERVSVLWSLAHCRSTGVTEVGPFVWRTVLLPIAVLQGKGDVGVYLLNSSCSEYKEDATGSTFLLGIQQLSQQSFLVSILPPFPKGGNKTQAKHLNKHFTKEDVQVASKHKEGWPPSSVIKEGKTSSTVTQHLITCRQSLAPSGFQCDQVIVQKPYLTAATNVCQQS